MTMGVKKREAMGKEDVENDELMNMIRVEKDCETCTRVSGGVENITSADLKAHTNAIVHEGG